MGKLTRSRHAPSERKAWDGSEWWRSDNARDLIRLAGPCFSLCRAVVWSMERLLGKGKRWTLYINHLITSLFFVVNSTSYDIKSGVSFWSRNMEASIIDSHLCRAWLLLQPVRPFILIVPGCHWHMQANWRWWTRTWPPQGPADSNAGSKRPILAYIVMQPAAFQADKEHVSLIRNTWTTLI